MMRGFRIDGERDLVFVPLGINYDRVLEDRTLLRSADPAAQRRGSLGALGTTLGFAFHNLRLALGSRLVPLRLRLRQLRRAGLDARLLPRARPRFPPPVGRGAQARRWRPSATT